MEGIYLSGPVFWVFWAQISVYVIALVVRLAAFGIYISFRRNGRRETPPIQNEFFRIGTDLSLVATGVFAAASANSSSVFRRSDGSEWVFVWVLPFIAIYLFNYLLYLTLMNKTVSEVCKSWKILRLVSSLLLGWLALTFAANLAAQVAIATTTPD